MLRNFGTVRPIFPKIAPKVAQDFKEKSHENSRCGKKNSAKLSWIPPPPPRPVRVKEYSDLKIIKNLQIKQRGHGQG